MTGSNILRLLACQIEIPPMTTVAERNRHLARIATEIRKRLAEEPVDLVVLPELASIDYSLATFDRLDVLAEPLDAPSYRRWSELAREHHVHVAYGFARRDRDRCHISVAVVGPKGDL